MKVGDRMTRDVIKVGMDEPIRRPWELVELLPQEGKPSAELDVHVPDAVDLQGLISLFFIG
ncbi:MAG: hypothetical protein JJE48_03400 [Actinobacteria bacterium]|nr:hypothetical protein [Actinomycetota bacterium]